MKRILLAVWILAFAVGCATHALELRAGGWMPYRFAPDALNLFWSLLAIVDPLVIALLFLRRGWGVVFGLAVILADVAANSWVVWGLGHPELFGPLQMQTLFLGFACGSAWTIRGSNPQS